MNKELLTQLSSKLRPAIEGEWRRLEIENKLLKEQIRLFMIEKYGAKSEQLSDEQLQLLESEPCVLSAEVQTEAQRPEAEKTGLQAARVRQHPGREELPAHLERRRLFIACTPEQCICTQCGREKASIGVESSEELDMEPVVFFVKVTEREKRACKKCEEMGVSTAPVPAKIIPKCKASDLVVVEVLISKYCNFQPLYRQQQTFWRDAGIELSRMTLCGWVMQCGTLLQAVCGAMRQDLLAGGYIQADETTVGVQSARTRGRNHQAYLWEYSRPGGPVVFDFRMGREREGPKCFLSGFNGRLQSDGYSAYDRIGGPGLVHCGCMAHARRGFVDALKVAPDDAGAKAVIAEIAKLYGVEKEAREKGLSHAERREQRQLRSLPVLTDLKQKIISLRKEALPKSALGKACDYALNQWSRLIVYAEHGEVEIDNNLCENGMRPIALGRKNWLHIGSEEAGPRVAAIASVIETCRRLKINVRQYLLDVLPKIGDWPAKRVAELTPMAWAAAQAAR